MQQPAREYTLVDMARAFMWSAHAAVGQVRKGTNEPYRVHPETAFMILQQYAEPTIAEQCAVLLHDVVEDTKVQLADLRWLFGNDITDIVNAVTNITTKADGNRATRLAMEINHITNNRKDITKGAFFVKLADIASNASTHTLNPEFARVWLVERLKWISRIDSEWVDYHGGDNLLRFTLRNVMAYVVEVFTPEEAFELYNRYVVTLSVIVSPVGTIEEFVKTSELLKQHPRI